MKKIVRHVWLGFVRLTPRWRFVDNVVSFINFILRHHRLPTSRKLINNEFFRMKTGKELAGPLRSFTTDKEFVKVYVKAIVGDDFNVPTKAVLKSREEIDKFTFPACCCIKPTHCSGLVVLRKAGEDLPLDEIKRWLEIDYYEDSREANYKNLKPKIMVEPLIFDSDNVEDFKFFCHDGKVGFIQVDIDRRTRHKRRFYDARWNALDFSIKYPRSERDIAPPDNLTEMIAVCEKLAAAFSLVRVDLYTDGRQCLVGEITHCSENAGGNFIPRAAEELASRLLFSPRAETSAIRAAIRAH